MLLRKEEKDLFNLFPAIMEVVSEGLKFLNEKEKKRIQDDYFDLLEKISEAENTENYTDYDLDILNEKMIIFLKAYAEKLRGE